VFVHEDGKVFNGHHRNSASICPNPFAVLGDTAEFEDSEDFESWPFENDEARSLTASSSGPPLDNPDTIPSLRFTSPVPTNEVDEDEAWAFPVGDITVSPGPIETDACKKVSTLVSRMLSIRALGPVLSGIVSTDFISQTHTNDNACSLLHTPADLTRSSPLVYLDGHTPRSHDTTWQLHNAANWGGGFVLIFKHH
jgi:hypothetical protein